jgi:hypothetical protein
MGGDGHATPRPLYPRKETQCPLYRRLGGPQGRCGRVRKISPPPGFDSPTVRPVASRYADWAIRAHEKQAYHSNRKSNCLSVCLSIYIPVYLFIYLFIITLPRKYRQISGIHFILLSGRGMWIQRVWEQSLGGGGGEAGRDGENTATKGSRVCALRRPSNTDFKYRHTVGRDEK